MKKTDKVFNTYIFAFTLIIWTLLNVSGIQNLYFDIDRDSSMIVIATIKIFHLFFLYFIFSKIYSLYTKRQTSKGKQEIVISLIYFAILITFLLLTWPGTWCWDDIVVLDASKSFELLPWHHFFSGVFQILCLQTIPIASGVNIVQVIIASLIIGYCISNISSLYGKNKKQTRILQIILVTITLSPPVIAYILSGYRMGMYSYLELLLISKMLILFKTQKKLTEKNVFEISFLTIIISSWRTEGLYYPFLIFILYLILGKKLISRKLVVISLLFVTIATYSIGQKNNQMIGTNNYSITATMEGITSIVKVCDESDKEEIDTINKVIDVQLVLDNPNWSGEAYYWNGVVNESYSEEEYHNYLKAYLKLLLKYPDAAFKSMWNIFVQTGSGLGKNNKQTTISVIIDTLQLFDQYSKSAKAWKGIESEFKQPINITVRNKVISFLGRN